MYTALHGHMLKKNNRNHSTFTEIENCRKWEIFFPPNLNLKIYPLVMTNIAIEHGHL
jgi:hypothetical protein